MGLAESYKEPGIYVQQTFINWSTKATSGSSPKKLRHKECLRWGEAAVNLDLPTAAASNCRKSPHDA